MNRPKFSEGEIVILQSESYPHLSGEYPVLGVWWEEKAHIVSGGIVMGTYVYDLPTELAEVDGWLESSLRKKYDGCGQDYNEMIKSLNVDIVEVV